MKRVCLILFLVLYLSCFALAADGNDVQVKTLAKSGLSWNGDPLPEYPKGSPEVTILDITIPPGATLPLHTHPVINAGIMLEGSLTVVTRDNLTLRLNSGDAIVEVVNTWHYGKNEGAVPARIVVFYAGSQNTPITVKQ